jgi:kumamolisin
MSDRKVFEDSVTPLPPQEGIAVRGMMVNAATPDHRKESMTVLFSLAIPPEAEADLEARVARGEVIDPGELTRQYGAPPDDRKALVKWLRAQGFKIEHSSRDGTSVYARGTVEQIERSLQVKMVRVTKDGVTYTAAQDAPSLPADVGKGVHAIIGLQPFRQAHKQSRKVLPTGGNRASLVRGSVGGTPRAVPRMAGRAATRARGAPPPPSRNVRNAPPFLVSEIRKAYGADGLALTGKGQTIAILIDTFPAAADVRAFWRVNRIRSSTTRVQKVNVPGGHLPPPEGEESLDVEWASGIAPGAKIRVYATGTLSFVDLDRALDQIIADLPSHPGMRQLSISLGLGETFMGGPFGEVKTQHQKFLRLAAAGVNVFVSSGDAGSNPDESGQNSNGPTQAEYESSDSSVIGVGGTTLKLTAGGGVASEVAWTSSGGGESIFFGRPTWQTGPGVPAGHRRLVPDVSLAADPNTGAFLVVNGQVTQIGGTSWSAPVWAGFCAMLNEARGKAKLSFLPFLNPLLYPLAGTNCFRDITKGSNGAFKAGPGYDRVCGIGVPHVGNLVKALARRSGRNSN